MNNQKRKCEEFAVLHSQPGAFIMPNPWDIGSATLLQNMGFKALATTSAGLAYSLGRADGQVSLEEKLQHCADMAANTYVPISADFENGFADSPELAAKNVLRLAATGVAGCSVEDFSPQTGEIVDFELSVERIQAVVEAVATLEYPFLITARAENLLRGVNDLDNTIERLLAYEKVGADVLYAPGIDSLEQLKQVTDELHTPFNVLAPKLPGATVSDFIAAGAKRVSTGGALKLATANPLLNAANEMLSQGSFDWVADMTPRGELEALLIAKNQ